jgi:hypothetical protein
VTQQHVVLAGHSEVSSHATGEGLGGLGEGPGPGPGSGPGLGGLGPCGEGSSEVWDHQDQE